MISLSGRIGSHPHVLKNFYRHGSEETPHIPWLAKMNFNWSEFESQPGSATDTPNNSIMWKWCSTQLVTKLLVSHQMANWAKRRVVPRKDGQGLNKMTPELAIKLLENGHNILYNEIMGLVKGVCLALPMLREKKILFPDLIKTIVSSARAEMRGRVGLFTVEEVDGVQVATPRPHTGINSEEGLHRLVQTLSNNETLGARLMSEMLTGRAMGRPDHFFQVV